MTRILFTTAFLLGLIVVVWMGVGFVGSDVLALMVTMVIGAVYIIGFIEQLQFRQATATLKSALDSVSGSVENLDQWLAKLHPSLQNNSRARIEGERVPLPSPVLTPYLVGLLVMLGLMGTFIGMVVTLKGAVIALQGTTELQAIRDGLTAPIGGLGLAFGTSVAGVAASAMLGLISTISRRERMFETARLDSKIATAFRSFSLVHNRQETYKAMQYQAQALPQVAERLQTMASQLENMGDRLSQNLSEKQEAFHQAVEKSYSKLAESVAESLQGTLEKSGQQVAESVGPMLNQTLQAVQAEAEKTHQALNETAQQQLQAMSKQFSTTAQDVNGAWSGGIKNMQQDLTEFSQQFEQSNTRLVQCIEQAHQQSIQQQQKADEEKLSSWIAALDANQQQVQSQAGTLADQLKDKLHGALEEFKQVNHQITDQLSEQRLKNAEQYEQMQQSLGQSLNDIASGAQSASEKNIEKVAQLLASTEALIETRIQSEKSWIEQQRVQADKITESLNHSLTLLREQEQTRSEAVIEQLSGLESKVAEHLSTLGQSLEEPMNRLFETASEAPKAAAEVIEKLRGEISNNIERDNSMLEERQAIMKELNALLASIEETSSGQRQAIESLVQDSGTMFKEVSSHISEHVSGEITKITEVADQFAGSAIELSSLGESFTVAVQQFSESNQAMMESLNKIEESLEGSHNRSDEQLAYYVAQAREIIDHSMMSQKEILEEMRHLSRQPDLFAEEVE